MLSNTITAGQARRETVRLYMLLAETLKTLRNVWRPLCQFIAPCTQENDDFENATNTLNVEKQHLCRLYYPSHEVVNALRFTSRGRELQGENPIGNSSSLRDSNKCHGKF